MLSQLVSLPSSTQQVEPCGFSMTPIFTAELAAQFEKDGMLAYVNLVQRKEKEIGCDVLTHQKWRVCFLV